MAIRKWIDSSGRDRYAVEFETRGHRVFRRLPPSATKAQAQQLETRLRHSLIDQQILEKRPDVSLEASIRAWLAESVAGRKAEKATTSHANCVLESVAGLELGDLPGNAAAAVREAGKELEAGTTNRRLCVLKAVAKFAWRRGWTAENLSARIQLLPERQYQRRDVTPAMARALIQNAPNARARALIALTAYTGLRLGEVLKLTPADIRGGVIVARDTKNGTDRIIPILPALRPHLSQIPFKAGWRNVYRGFQSARKRAKLSLRYHDLRHMVGSALTNTGAGLRVVGDILGHESIQTTRRYTHPDLKVKRKAMEKALRPISLPIKRRAKAKKCA